MFIANQGRKVGLSILLFIMIMLMCSPFVKPTEPVIHEMSIRCSSRHLSYRPQCLKETLESRLQGSSLYIVQVNAGFLSVAMNLICSADKLGIPRTRFMVWSMDNITHDFMEGQGILSFYNPSVYFGSKEAVPYHSENYNRMMRERPKFWKFIHSLGISFWWIDADIVLQRPIDEMTTRLPVSNADIIYQMDGPWRITSKEAIEYYRGGTLPENKWFEGCGGLFFARSVPSVQAFFEKLETFLIENPDLEDQQAINRLLRDKKISQFVEDPDFHPVQSKLSFGMFLQLDAWIGHIRFSDTPFSQWPEINVLKDVKPYLMHANTVWGQDKIDRLKGMNMWLVEDKDGRPTCRM